MLTSIFIKNIVLIEKLNINFENGLNVLTGETGAGKSILLDSLGLSLGYRSDVGLIRYGEEKATVISTFSLEKNHPVFKVLKDEDIEIEDEDLILKRTIESSGKSKAFINNVPVSIGFLRRVGEELVEIHGQFETQGLLNPATHIDVLDDFAKVSSDRKEIGNLYFKLKSLQETLANLEMKAENSINDKEYFEFAYEEIDRANPKVNEEEEISELRYRLMNKSKVIEALKEALENLNDYTGAETKLTNAMTAIDKVADKAGEEISTVTNALDSTMAEMQNAISELQAMTSNFNDMSINSLEEVEERYFALKGLARKYNCSVDDLAKVKDEFKASLDSIENLDEDIKNIKQEIKSVKTEYMELATKLSEKRRKFGEELTNKVMAELPDLKLEKARFTVHIVKKDISADGIDSICFKISTSPKSPLGELNKIASGGELARFMLAIKVIVAGNSSLPVMIFDEVDSGVGGATADAVGKKLKMLSKSLQILVITHSAQVAGKASYHLKVKKDMVGESLITHIDVIDKEHRVNEIARMLSGEEITEEGISLAKQLMK